MHFLLTFILLCSSIANSLAALSQNRQYSPDGKCRTEGKYYAIGESWPGQGCSEYYCVEDGENEVNIISESCGVVGAGNCPITFDNTKVYPECCIPIINCGDN